MASMTPAEPKLHVLVACGGCGRQYEASTAKAGRKFHCACGTTVTIPKTESHTASVTRCAACGAPRSGDESSCTYCKAEFTVFDRDLNTVCPSCVARISDRANYCHHCGTQIAPAGGGPGEESSHVCPACPGGHALHHRKLQEDKPGVEECLYCGGLWVGREALERLVRDARDRQRPLAEIGKSGGAEPVERPRDAPVYRRCPSCSKSMNRRNYEQRSGVIVDTCLDHGVWFDAHELDAILRWIKDGGEQRARKRNAEAAREERRQRDFLKTIEAQKESRRSQGGGGFYPGGNPFDDGIVTTLIRGLFDI